jgi:uncharacterized protein (DUF2062 family)
MRDFMHKKLIAPLKGLLRQGISPKKIALSMAVGFMLGLFPVIGSTTILCAIAAILLRINLPATQLANYAAYPLQIALLIPFYQFGAWLFDAEPLAMSTQQLMSLFGNGILNAVEQLWTTTLRAIAAWATLSLPAGAILYGVVLIVIRVAQKMRLRHSIRAITETKSRLASID